MSLIEDIKKKLNLGKREVLEKNEKKVKENFSDKALDKFSKEEKDYPNKSEYEENIKIINENELNSERFKKTKKFVIQYHQRGSLELEKKLFEIVGTYGIEDKLINKKYDYKKQARFKRYSELQQFLSSLTQEEINSNLYLKAATIFMKTSVVDCNLIIEKLGEELAGLEVLEKSQRLELNMNIPEERLKILPTSVPEYTTTQYYKPNDYKYEYVYLLDKNNQYVYSDYNRYVRNINKLATDIYFLQMWNLLSIYLYPVQIENYYFSILNNDFEHEFRTAYFVKNDLENVSDLDCSNLRVNYDNNSQLDEQNLVLQRKK